MPLPENFQLFQQTLDSEVPPEFWPEALQALWWDAKGDWQNSHEIAQEINSDLGHWIHAYLHRKEGDRWNAEYWYRRAHRVFPDMGLDEELETIVEYILNNSPQKI